MRGLAFSKAWSKKVRGELHQVGLNFICLEDLIKLKRTFHLANHKAEYASRSAIRLENHPQSLQLTCFAVL